ncbi:hypothetical protein Y032_0003g1250 [Ancylostoma ceylanicum]|uniref:Uncharacterized protein n=1 Tax=Ancylostoma ceylanicum TaxID=53326 RepID=A0A016VWU4_9BILA|nr:hypothetical protein Y032_0003g1250 [Ancylostoma ceylanicum]
MFVVGGALCSHHVELCSRRISRRTSTVTSGLGGVGLNQHYLCWARRYSDYGSSECCFVDVQGHSGCFKAASCFLAALVPRRRSRCPGRNAELLVVWWFFSCLLRVFDRPITCVEEAQPARRAESARRDSVRCPSTSPCPFTRHLKRSR